MPKGVSQDTKTTILTFTANSPGDIYHPFTSVNITNVTRGWTETLVYPDTVLVLMNVTTTVDELELCDNSLDVFPNPFSGQTTATFQMDAAGWAYVKVYGVNGIVIASHEGWFEKGSHRLSITLEKPQMAILSVTTLKGNLVAKLIQTEHCGYNKIEVCNVENRNGISKEAKEIGDFIRGDVMSYEAILEDGYRISSDTITQEQYEDEIITLHFPSPIGTVNGLFSVSATKQVWFSRGNLQYKASTNTWRFAENQFDYIGEGNCNISPNYDGYIDLFGWGTSGWNCGNTYYHPWDSDHSDASLYGPPGQHNLSGDYANSDWGYYNAISNGGNQINQWYTLLSSEWEYVFNVRQASTINGAPNSRFVKATVNGVAGIILFPDVYSHPDGVPNPEYINQSSAAFSVNNYQGANWLSMEYAGAVFLPAAGTRSETHVWGTGSRGQYWSTACRGGGGAVILFFKSNNIYTLDSGDSRYNGDAVRLVQIVQ